MYPIIIVFENPTYGLMLILHDEHNTFNNAKHKKIPKNLTKSNKVDEFGIEMNKHYVIGLCEA